MEHPVLLECVPNFSEGRRPAVMNAIQAAVEDVAGVALLDRHHDATHNRLVLTFVGGPGPVAEAAFRSAAVATRLVDMRQHTGVHPRIGAADVIPFVPLGDTPMRLCVDLARRVGRRLAAELNLPVYLYAEAATTPERRSLPLVRRGEYEGLAERFASDPASQPDFGPARVGTAGAIAVGARHLLVAFNMTLATGDLSVARAIARELRASSGGYPAVQARAFRMAEPQRVQVSVNLLDLAQTPLHVVFDHVVAAARKAHVDVVESELVGLLPTAALAETTRHYLRLRRLDAAQVVEAALLPHVLTSALGFS